MIVTTRSSVSYGPRGPAATKKIIINETKCHCFREWEWNGVSEWERGASWEWRLLAAIRRWCTENSGWLTKWFPRKPGMHTWWLWWRWRKERVWEACQWSVMVCVGRDKEERWDTFIDPFILCYEYLCHEEKLSTLKPSTIGVGYCCAECLLILLCVYNNDVVCVISTQNHSNLSILYTF